jgi:phage gp16-like protein
MSALAKIHIAKKELNLHDDDYRAILERVTGQNTAKGLSNAQADAVVAEFKRMGFKPKLVVSQAGRRLGKTAAAQHDTARKARALWLSLWQLGIVRKREEAALEAFAKRQLGCERMVWADQQMMFRLIEALKAMAERAGWSQDLAGTPAGMQTLVLKRRLVLRQREMLGMLPPAHLYAMTENQLTAMARDLAFEIQSRAA